MGKTRSWLYAAALVSLAGSLGCKKAPPAPQPHDNPPAYDQAAGTFGAWVEGRWCPTGGVDAKTAEKYGVDPASDLDISQFWEFKADGTLAYGKLDYPGRVTGKWVEENGVVMLMYEAWDGETLYDRRARLAKEEETGTQAAIAAMMGFENTVNMLEKMSYLELTDDKKGLTFTSPPSNEGASFADMLSGGDSDLVRMK
jgi:hypothetical protein